jgi:hypothetical protein
MDAQGLIQEKLANYQQRYERDCMARFRVFGLVEGQAEPVAAPEPVELIQAFDPGVLRGEFESAIREIGSDVVSTFNGLLDELIRKRPAARAVALRYKAGTDAQISIETRLRQAFHPVTITLLELGTARTAFLNFHAQAGQKALGSGFAAGQLGSIVGGLLLPGVGNVLGGLLGGAWAGNQVDEQAERLVQDFQQRFQAFADAVDAAWRLMSAQLDEQFTFLLGATFQKIAQEIEARPTSQSARLAPVRTATRLGNSRVPRWVTLGAGTLALVAATSAATWFLTARTATTPASPPSQLAQKSR